MSGVFTFLPGVLAGISKSKMVFDNWFWCSGWDSRIRGLLADTLMVVSVWLLAWQLASPRGVVPRKCSKRQKVEAVSLLEPCLKNWHSSLPLHFIGQNRHRGHRDFRKEGHGHHLLVEEVSRKF